MEDVVYALHECVCAHLNIATDPSSSASNNIWERADKVLGELEAKPRSAFHASGVVCLLCAFCV